MDVSSSSAEMAAKWHHPADVMRLHTLKLKKRSLQARLSGQAQPEPLTDKTQIFENIISNKKRSNPFKKGCAQLKRTKVIVGSPVTPIDESSDQTLFNLLHNPSPSISNVHAPLSSFANILQKSEANTELEFKNAKSEKWFPTDWSLVSKMRLWSTAPFPWNNKLKMSEEASGVTGFARCLTTPSVDTSINARFHQCCLLWQHPVFPWLTLFPRTNRLISTDNGTVWAPPVTVRTELQSHWSDSFRSLFQLLRTKQCPYFYLCANAFCILFRAAGMAGFQDLHAIITPTTRGFRKLLKRDNIEYVMPLKKKRMSDQGYETLDSTTAADDCNLEGVPEMEIESHEDQEQWLKKMGINDELIRQINYTEDKLIQRTECEVDMDTEQSLVLIEGLEVNSLYNFLINCKSISALTGALAGIPPTLLSPVAFHGATLSSLKVRDYTKVNINNCDYYSMEISGPIIPSTIHNIFHLVKEHASNRSISADLTVLPASEAFSKVRSTSLKTKDDKSEMIFGIENLSDCGLDESILRQFCLKEHKYIQNVDCIKFNGDDGTYTWT